MKKIFLIISLAILILSIGSVSAAENFKGDNATNNSVSFVSNQSYQSNDFNNSVNSNHKSVSISGVVSDCITSKPFPGVSVKVKTLSGVELGQTTTGQNGIYNLSFLSNETKFIVIAAYAGHLSPTQQVSTVLNNSTGITSAVANFRLGQPSVAIGSPGETFINESFSLQVTFDNPSSTTGFGPIVQLSLPSQITFNSASYLGNSIKTYDLGIFTASGQIYNPLTRQMVNGTPGYRLIILEYPFGSFTPDQPAAPVTVNARMAANATLGVPLNITATPVFRFGDDPLDNPSTDPPIFGPRANSTVTPTVIRLTKTTTVSENEISTGPNYPVTYILTLDIASGAVVNNVTISDLLSGNMQFLNMINSSGGNFTAPNSTTRGGIINVTFGTLVGIAGTDKTVTYRAYAPEFNSTSLPVINPLTGLPSSGPNDSWATGKYGNLTVTDNGTNTNYNITLRSLSIQKSVLDLNGPNVKPTDTLQYSIAFQVSDYFQFKNIIITDIIGDGQSFLSSFIPYLIINTNGTTNNITFNSSNYNVTHNNATGTWTIVFNVSQQMIDSGLSGILTGGLYNNRSINLGATTGSIFFRSLIDIAFEDPANFHGGNPFLTSNDVTTNAVNIAAGLTNSTNNVTESSGTSIMIVAPTIEKKLYAINGNTTNLTYFIKPGDLVTFSLRVVVPTTNLENFTINDFLPIPFFNATQVSLTNSTQGDTPPGVGQWCLASDDTLSSFLGRVPILTIGALDNTLSFSYGLVNSTDQNVRIAHILFTVNATNNPMADGLYLTNLMNIMYANSPGATFSDNAIISFITQEPSLNITKGILNTTGAGTISPPPSILPVNGNLTGADAGDKVTFVITIGNQGSYNAYNTIIKDSILSGFVNFNLISVAYGNGTSILNYTGNLTNATGLILNNIIPGNSTVLITYSVDVASNVYPRQIINNTAQITNYGSTDGGPNYVQDQSLFQDQASVTIADPTISKNLVNSTDPGTSGNNLTIGEQGTFRITVTLPEGQIQNLRISDILPSGLAYDGNYTIDLSGFNGTLGSLTFTVVGNNITFLFNGNSTILGDNNNSTNTFYINLKTVVLNNLASNPITGAALSKTNTVNLNWDNNPGSQLTTNYNFNVLQPQLNLIKTITPNPAVGGQIVTVRLNLTNNGLSPAYNITITDSLNGNAFNWATVVANSTPSGFSFNYNSSSGIVTYTDGTLLNGQNAIFTFNVTLMNNIISNSSYNNSATATYDSLNITTIPRTENRNYTVTNSTLLRTVAPSITKGIFNTSEIDSTGTNIFIGEVVTYQLNITIPAGVTQNLTIRDVLNNGLSYIQLRSLISRSSGNITATGFNFTSLNITDFQAINETTISPLTFSLGNVTNNNPNSLNETISLLFSVVLRNDAVNTGNRTIGNIGNIDFLNATNQSRTISSNTQNIVVRLPNLSVTKTASNTAPQGTDSITFTIVVRNNNGAMAPVYDGVIWDMVDANFVNVRNITITNSTLINFNQTFDNSTGNLTVTFDRLPVNQNLTITFVADLKQNITFNQTTANRVNVTGTSLPGTNGSGGQTPGAPGTSTGERTGDPTMPAGAVNNINATALVNITARSPSINKTSGGSKNVNLTIGATAPQTIVISIPIGTTNNLRITDLVPNGLSVVAGLFNYTIGSNLTVQISTPTAIFNSTTNTWEFVFGQVNATQFSNITIDYTVMVLNVIGNQNGVNLTNNATVYYQGATGEVNGGSSTTTTRVIEPDLQIIKTASTNIKPGDICTFTLNISHKVSSTSNAHDLIIVDNIPAGMTYLDTTSLPGAWTADATQTGKIIFNGPALLLGQNATIIFRCTVNNNASLAGTNITNIANLTYSSLSGNDTNERIYNTSGSSVTHILGADIFVTKNAPATIYAGQQINFTINVGNNGPDTAVNVVLNDLIDPVWFARMNNVQYRLNGTWYNLTNPITLNLGNISSLSNITILVRGIINSSAPVGTLNNSVNVTTDTPDPIPGNNSAQTSTTVQQLADIVVDKNGPATVIAGNNISYTISVTNNGPSDALNVHLFDSIPAQLINIIYSTNGVNWISWPPAGGFIDLGTLIANQSSTVWVNATVPSSTANGTVLNNSVNATTTTPVNRTATDSVNTTVNTQADLQVDKNGPSIIIAGNQIFYTISVTNNGPSDALNVQVYDNVPAQLTNVKYSLDGINWINWPPVGGYINLGTILANITNNTRIIYLNGIVNPSTANGTELNNTVNVTTTTPDPTPNIDTVITTVESIADIHVSKLGPASAIAGQDVIKYTISVGNNGPSVAHSTMLYDNITFLSNVQYSLNDVNWSSWTGSLLLGELNPGSVTNIFIRGLLPANASGTLNNTVTVNTTSLDEHPENNTASALTNVNTTADVYVVKSVVGPVVAGLNVTYNLLVGNVGPSVARDVVLTDLVPVSVLNPVYSVNGVSMGIWSGSYLVGNLTPGSLVNVTISGLLSSDALGVLNNTGSVNSSTFDNFTDNNTSNVSSLVNTTADVYVVKTGPVIAIPGKDVVTYVITVGNNGPSDAREVVLTDSIPPVILSPLYSMDNGFTWNTWSGNLSLGNMTPGNVFEILIRGALSSSATQAFNNTAIINSSTYDPILENNTSTAEVKIKTADIAVIKSVNVSNPKYWSNVVFTICTINNGPNGATGVSIKDILPAGLKFISYTTTQGTYNHNTGIWDIGSLNNGSYVWLNIAAQVVKSNTAIINIASKYSENEYDPYPENDSDNATVHVAAAADLGIKKTVSAKSAYFGKKLYFTIIVQNWGPDTSTGVKVKDVLPKGLRFVSYTTNYGKYNHKTGIWNINLLPAHKIAKLTITFYGVRSGKKINVARVSSKTYDPIIRPGDSKVSSATVLIKRPKCHYHPHHSHQNTVPMQHTGLPFAALIMAILMIMGGFISSKKTKKITK